MKKLFRLFPAIAVLFFVPVSFAQLQSSQTLGVTVQVTIQNTISLTETGGSLTFDPATGISNQVTFTSNSNLDASFAKLTLYTWFSNGATALTAGSSNVASSVIQASYASVDTSGAGFCNATPAVGNGVVDGSACPAFDIAKSVNQDNMRTASATFSLSIPNFAAQKLPAGSYSGTLNALVLAI
jgi:hypothetical protein